MDALAAAQVPGGGEVPDVAGVIVGWRAWRVVQRSGGPELVAPVRGTRWSPGRATHARCTSGHHDAAAIPAADCRCGLYAVADPRGVVGQDGPGAVLGCAALYGDVLEGSRGWRASRGVVRVLVAGPDVDDATCRGLAARYGVPVRRAATSLTTLATGLAAHRADADALRRAVGRAVDGTADGTAAGPGARLDACLRAVAPRPEPPAPSVRALALVLLTTLAVLLVVAV
ncbi:hypothetical protein ACFPK1_11645 [Actinomycetospora rhizophila]|uniref:Uncharacterized protein n=1 Tax=Actinomycetospora rhizophila TaxID=1416876 RepID=A0ABV9ZFC5_9PSEU